jgi:hypothetical protein
MVYFPKKKLFKKVCPKTIKKPPEYGKKLICSLKRAINEQSAKKAIHETQNSFLEQGGCVKSDST